MEKGWEVNNMAFCANCGAIIADNAKFCVACGTAVTNDKTNTRETMYDGQIHKCPNCGEVLNSFVPICPSCGYELRGTKHTSSVNELAKRIEMTESTEKKIELIRNFYIPNTKEDICEFFILATSNLNVDGDEADAWRAKMDQAYQKAKLTFGSTPEFEYLTRMYKDANQKRVITSFGKTILFVALIIIGALMMIIGFFAGHATGDSDSPFYFLALIGMFPAMAGGFGLMNKNKKSK